MDSKNLPDSPVALVPAERRISVGRMRPTTCRATPEDLKKAEEEQKDKARYKIEVLFHPTKRSSLAHKPAPVMVLIWESGKRLHGGGDEKMYWCGYPDCGKPFPSDDFGYMHVVCRHCQREQFLDPDARATHIKMARREGKDSSGLERMPIVGGERLANLTPPNLAELLVKTWYQLEGNADVYFKHTSRKIRYDKLHETSKDMDNLELVRIQRKPGILTLKDIRRDLANGADLKSMFLAMIVA